MDTNKNQNHSKLEKERASILSRLKYQEEIYAELSNDEFYEYLKLKERLKRIDNALERFMEGQYGKRTFYGQEIDADRRDLLPEAELCMHYQYEKEKLKNQCMWNMSIQH